MRSRWSRSAGVDGEGTGAAGVEVLNAVSAGRRAQPADRREGQRGRGGEGRGEGVGDGGELAMAGWQDGMRQPGGGVVALYVGLRRWWGLQIVHTVPYAGRMRGMRTGRASGRGRALVKARTGARAFCNFSCLVTGVRPGRLSLWLRV